MTLEKRTFTREAAAMSWVSSSLLAALVAGYVAVIRALLARRAPKHATRLDELAGRIAAHAGR